MAILEWPVGVVAVYLCFLFVAFARADEPLPYPNLTPEQEAKLSKGEPVLREEQFTDDKGHRVGRGVVYIVIDAPPEKIWDVILDYDHYAEFYPNVHKAEITKKEGNHIYVYFVLNALGVLKIKYNIDHTFHKDENRLTWKMDQSKKNDFKESIGFWQIWPRKDGKSLVCYSVYVETGRWIPGFLQKAVDSLGITSWALGKVATCMKNRVEQGEAYKGEEDRKL